MAYSIKTYAGTGAAGAFTTPEYLESSHIEVYVDDVLKQSLLITLFQGQ